MKEVVPKWVLAMIDQCGLDPAKTEVTINYPLRSTPAAYFNGTWVPANLEQTGEVVIVIKGSKVK